ncbi:MAG TPA: type II secretion system F family protein [Methylomirabilota bacterium]|jgi:tight adherence protein B
MILTAALLVFLVIILVAVGGWWLWQSRERLRRRLGSVGAGPAEAQLLKSDAAPSSSFDLMARRSALVNQATALAEQAGYKQSAGDLLLLLLVFGVVGGVLGIWRLGNVGGAIIATLVAASLPVLYFVYRRARRLQAFQEHFADAVDMISRSMRAGNALPTAIQLVGDEMADPIGQEFRQVSEEIRLGLDPAEALGRLRARVPNEDVAFFCTAVNIQRAAGGNLAEILDRLSDVIRKRFELLSHARVLSSQQRYAAVFVGMSPIVFCIIFYFISPGYFDPLIESPNAPMLVGGGFVSEVIGFAVIWRMARIKV